MVVKEVEETVKRASEPAKGMAVTVLGVLAGLPLVVLIPVLLLFIGVSIYVVVTLLPFIVAGIVFVLAFYVARWVKLKEPWNVLVPVGSALIAILPHFASSFTQTAMSLAGEGTSYALTPLGFIAVCLFVALFASGAWVFIKKDDWSALGVSLTAVFLLLAVVPGLMGSDVGGDVVSLEGVVPANSASWILLLILLAGIALVWVAYRRNWSFGAR